MLLFDFSVLLLLVCVEGYFPKLATLKMAAVSKIAVKPGSIVALVTPMKKSSNEIDYSKLDDLLEWHVSQVRYLILTK